MPIPNPAEFYSPIIQAMIHSAQQQRELQQNQALAEQHKQELALRQQQADRADKHLDFLEDQEKQKNASAASLQEAIKNNDLLNTRLNIGRAFREGILKAPTQAMSQQQPGAIGVNQAGGTSPTSMNLPGVGKIDTSQFSNPQEAATQEAAKLQQTAQATATGTGSGQEPFKIKEDARKAEEDRLKRIDEYNKAIDVQKARGADELTIENARGGYQKINTQLQGANRLKEIALQQQLGSDDPVSAQAITDQNIRDVQNGQRAYSTLSKQEKLAFDSTMSNRGWVTPTNQKDQSAKLDDIKQMDTMLSDYQNIISKYSRDSPPRGQDTGTKVTQGISKMTGGMWTPVIPGSDLSAKLDDVKSTAGKLVTQFEGVKRMTDAAAIRAVTGTFNPAYTVEQNMANYRQKAGLLNDTIQRTFAGMPPAQVTKILGDNKISNLGGLVDTGAPIAGSGTNPPATVRWGRDAQGNPIQLPAGNQ